MSKQITDGAKELYRSVKPPKDLREKTLSAVTAQKNRHLHINFKVWGAVAACMLLCFALLFSNSVRNNGISVAIDGDSLSSQSAICRLSNVNYIPDAVSPSAKVTSSDSAICFELDFKGEITVKSDFGRIAVQDETGVCREIAQGTQIKDPVFLYIFPEENTKIAVTFTSEKQITTVLIQKNTDGTYTVTKD